MVDKQVSLERKMIFIDRLLAKRGNIKTLLSFYGHPTPGGENDRRVKDRTLRYLGLISRTQDEFGIYHYKLTTSGERLAGSLSNLMDEIEKILPKEE